MNIVVLLILGILLALLLIYWYSRKNEGFGDGIALICILVSRPFIVLHDKLKEHTPEPTKAEDEKSEKVEAVAVPSVHRKVNAIVGDEIAGCIGAIIVAADTYLAVVFNSALFKTHEVALSSSIFSWCAGLLWIAIPAMLAMVTLECAGIVKSSGIFPNLGTAARWIIGSIAFLLMCLSIFLIMYAYAFRGVKVFDPTNTLQVAQMGEGILTLLGLLVGAASIPALIAVINALSTLLTIISFALLVACQLITSFLDAYCLFVTGGETSVFMSVDKPLKVIVQEFQFPLRRSKRLLQASRADEDQRTAPALPQENVVTPLAEEKPQNQQAQGAGVSAVAVAEMPIVEPVFVEFSGIAVQNGHDTDADQDKKTVRAKAPTEQQWPSALQGKRARTGAYDESESA